MHLYEQNLYTTGHSSAGFIYIYKKKTTIDSILEYWKFWHRKIVSETDLVPNTNEPTPHSVNFQSTRGPLVEAHHRAWWIAHATIPVRYLLETWKRHFASYQWGSWKFGMVYGRSKNLVVEPFMAQFDSVKLLLDFHFFQTKKFEFKLFSSFFYLKKNENRAVILHF